MLILHYEKNVVYLKFGLITGTDKVSRK